MPSVTDWGIDSSDEPEDLKGFEAYDGPPLPADQVFQVHIERIGLSLNRNNDKMLRILVKVSETEPSKKKYNGAAVWHNQNINEQGKPYLKQFLTALGLTWSDFFGPNKVKTESQDLPTQITKIGPLVIEKHPELRILTKMGKGSEQYPAKIEVARFLPKRSAVEASSGDSEETSEPKAKAAAKDGDDLF